MRRSMLGVIRFPGHKQGQTSLKSPYVLVQKTMYKRLAVVQPAPYKGCSQGPCTMQANMFSDAARVLDVVNRELQI